MTNDAVDRDGESAAGMGPARPPLPETEVCGFRVNPLVRAAFLDFVTWHVLHRRRVLMTHLNLHGLAMCYESPVMAALLRRPETVVTIDGMSLVLLSQVGRRRLGPRHRVTSLDYIDELMQRAITGGWRLYYVGGRPDVLERGLAYLRARHLGLQIGGHHGYFDIADLGPDSEQARVLADIARQRPDIVIVGMGMPRQEEWVDLVRDRVEAPVLITIGAMMEYFTGDLPKPPRWLGPLGLEWLFRVATAPRRLAHRYFIEPFVLLRRIQRSPPSGDRP